MCPAPGGVTLLASRAMVAIFAKWPAMSGVISFPKLPADCPPTDAAEATIDAAYLFCYSVPVTKADFIPLAESGATRPLRSKEKQCQACGISLYLELRDAQNLANDIPKFREMILVSIELTPEDGVLKRTSTHDRPSHHTLWQYGDAPFRDSVRVVQSGSIE